MSDRPPIVIDPVCGMKVDVAHAEAAGLTDEIDGRTYAFCRSGCRRAFLEEPYQYAARVQWSERAEGGHGDSAAPPTASPVIDEGMLRWYRSCSCCLSDAYPEIKAQLDAERAGMMESPDGPRIDEVAEAPGSAGAPG